MRRRLPPVTRTDLRRLLRAGALALALAVAPVVAAGAPGAATPAPVTCPVGTTQTGPPVVASDTEPAGATTVAETLVDHRRRTEATAAGPARDCRVLPVEVHLPSPGAAPGARPLVVVVHGRDGDPAGLRPLLAAWVAAGYVVAAPTFPITRKDDHDKPLGDDVAEQAGDVSFVLDQLLAQARDPASPLAGRIDGSRIGAVGHSLGGMTVYGLIANSCCVDPRIRAAVEMAGVHRDFPGGRWERQHAPVLLLHGDADKGYHNSVDAYPTLAAPKWFVTLQGSFHSPPFETPRGSEAALVDATTTLFWNRYLLGDRAAARGIVAAVAAASDRATLTRDLTGS